METCQHHEAIAKDIADTKQDVRDSKDLLTKIYKRLFEDNGVESFQTFRVKTNHWITTHDKNREHKVSFWYWLIPIIVSVGLVVIDKVFK